MTAGEPVVEGRGHAGGGTIGSVVVGAGGGGGGGGSAVQTTFASGPATPRIRLVDDVATCSVRIFCVAWRDGRRIALTARGWIDVAPGSEAPIAASIPHDGLGAPAREVLAALELVRGALDRGGMA